jgi:hypothetical protein
MSVIVQEFWYFGPLVIAPVLWLWGAYLEEENVTLGDIVGFLVLSLLPGINIILLIAAVCYFLRAIYGKYLIPVNWGKIVFHFNKEYDEID